MNKILITIYVVSLDKEFNLRLPIGKKIVDIIDLIQDSLVDLSNGSYIKKENVFLYLPNGLIVNPNNVLKYSGLKNGMKVTLL